MSEDVDVNWVQYEASEEEFMIRIQSGIMQFLQVNKAMFAFLETSVNEEGR